MSRQVLSKAGLRAVCGEGSFLCSEKGSLQAAEGSSSRRAACDSGCCWIIKSDVTSEKIANGSGYALRVYRDPDPTSNFYAFETPKFETAADAALPVKITFDLATDKTSKLSINLRCGTNVEDPTKDDHFAYNWDGTKSFKKNADDNSNAYNVVNFGDTNFHEVSIVFGEEITKEFWQNQNCRLEFKYGKKASFDVKVDNFVIHTKAGECLGEDIPDEDDDDDDTNDDDADSGSSGVFWRGQDYFLL